LAAMMFDGTDAVMQVVAACFLVLALVSCWNLIRQIVDAS
jgi:hypothetical protein